MIRGVTSLQNGRINGFIKDEAGIQNIEDPDIPIAHFQSQRSEVSEVSHERERERRDLFSSLEQYASSSDDGSSSTQDALDDYEGE